MIVTLEGDDPGTALQRMTASNDEFMRWFDGTVVSAHEGVIKPEREIFERLLRRYHLDPERTLMIDDARRNVDTAASLGMKTVHFSTPRQLRSSLEDFGLL